MITNKISSLYGVSFLEGLSVNKSDKLDELRLEVGMIAEKVNSLSEFYIGIINTIGNRIPKSFRLAIYQCKNGYYSLFSSFGDISEKKHIKFGEGMFSICSIRGKLTIENRLGIIKAYAPFYDGHHLIGVLFAECQDYNYEVTDEDQVFLQEITRYIEVKGKQYASQAIDNCDS